MGKFLNNLGKWTFKNKFKTLFIWLIFFAIFLISMGKMGSHFDENLKLSGLPSIDAQKTIKNEFHQNLNSGTMKVVLKTDKKDAIQNKNLEKDVQKTIKSVSDDKSIGTKSISSPYANQSFSKDKTTGMVNITFKKDSNLVSKDAVNKVTKAFNKLRNNHTQVEYSGNVQITPTNLGGISEIVGIIVAFIILVVLFRSFITAGLPIVTSVIGLISGIALVTIGSNFISITNVAQTLMTMIALAVGIDYALFIVHRYRGDLLKIAKPEEAMGESIQKAGGSVLFAGITVIIAVSGLSLIKMDFLTQMGLAAAVGVIFAVLSALTLLPALISLFNKQISASAKKKNVSEKNGFFANLTVKKPFVVALIGLIVLVIFASFSSKMRLGMPNNGTLPDNQTERKAYDITADKFGKGSNSQLIGVVKLNSSNSSSEKNKTLNKITNHISKMDNVNNLQAFPDRTQLEKLNTPDYQNKLKLEIGQKVQADIQKAMQQNPKMSPKQMQQLQGDLAKKYQAQFQGQAIKGSEKNYLISDNGKYALIQVTPKEGPDSVKTEKLANQINSYSKQIQKDYKYNVILTGSNAVNIDTVKKLNAAIPMFSIIVMALAFVLLTIVFRSFIIPIIAMLGFGLSLLASFGLTTLVMQEGFLKSLFGISKAGPILAFLPVIVIGLLFGLAMDYEVFMVSRIREEYIKTGDNTKAVIAGIKGSGPVIVAAALIMIAVFGSFMLSSNPTIKSMGLSLAFGVLFDAFFVRLMLVPSMIKIFGKVNWIFPAKKNK